MQGRRPALIAFVIAHNWLAGLQSIGQRVLDRLAGEVVHHQVFFVVERPQIREHLPVLRIDVLVVAVDECGSLGAQRDQSRGVVVDGVGIGNLLRGVDARVVWIDRQPGLGRRGGETRVGIAAPLHRRARVVAAEPLHIPRRTAPPPSSPSAPSPCTRSSLRCR